jgi:hypothetical protein
MYFVTAGEAESLHFSQGHVLYTFKAGDHFGDIGVFPELCPVRTSSMRAKTDMEALELGTKDLHMNIKPYFPDFFQALKDLASTRMYWLQATELTDALAARSQARCKYLKEETRSLNRSKCQVLRDRLKDTTLTTLEANPSFKGTLRKEHEVAPQKPLKPLTGVFYKRGHINMAFKKRFFVLHERTIFYFSSQEDYEKKRKPKGVVSCENAVCDEEEGRGNIGGRKAFYFKVTETTGKELKCMTDDVHPTL